MKNYKLLEQIFESLRFAWLEGDVFNDVTEYMDCVRRVKEKFQ